jgi:filamentous hemagglutinin family protein
MRVDRLFLGLLLGIGGSIGVALPSAVAQSNIVADPTVGTEVIPNFSGLPIEAIRGGTERGQNLFHSFQEFNISPDRAALFLVPTQAIQNIFARVTGQNLSQIDGTLGTRLDGTFALSTANLFLMNPNGIIFGAGGRLDVGGSFVATTANAIEFGDRGRFSATSPEVPSVLTINPSAFLFTQITAQPIVNQSRAINPNAPTLIDGLRVRNGMSLLLLGGDIVFDGGVVQAAGQVGLGALRGMGQIDLTVNGRNLDINLPDGAPLADITLTNGAIVGANGVVGVAIQVHSANLTIANASTIGSIVFGDEDGKTLKFQVGKLNLIAGGRISAFTFGSGKSSDIEINAETIELIGLSNDRQSVSAIESESRSTGAGGKAGDVVIRTQRLAVKDGAFISTQTLGQGQGGNLTVTAREAMMLSGTGTRADGRVFKSGLFSTTSGVGGANNLRVLETGQLTIREGALINASTFGTGKGGNVEINADTIELIGLSNDRQSVSAIGSESVSTGVGGKAGDVVIRAQRLAIKDGARISTQTFGQGQGGNLTVIAREAMTLSGTATLGNGQAVSSGLFSTTAGAGGAGNLRVLETGQLTVRAGARINASTRGTGQGGNVEINANAIELVGLSNDRQFASFIASTSVSTGAGGKAGDMVLTSQRLAVKDGAFISTQTFGQGQGGNLTVTAREAMTLSGTGTLPDGQAVPSELLSTTANEGGAGNIQISTGSLNIQDGARISASATGLGRASSINVKVDDTLKMENGSISSASLFSEGSDLTVTAGKIRLQGNSDITTNVFSGVGSGGNITLTAKSIVALNDSDILAFARDGKGGNVTLNTRAFFGQNYRPAPFGTDPTTFDGNDRVDINASGSLSSGTIVTPDTSFIQNSLSQLPGGGIDTNTLLAKTCLVRKDGPEGTFYISGTGGIPNRPNDPALSAYPTNTIQPTTQTAQRSWKLGDPIVEPQGFYKLANGRLVMNRECNP